MIVELCLDLLLAPFYVIGYLYLLQIGLQSIMLACKYITGNASHPFIIFGHSLFGLTGENMPNRPFLRHGEHLTYIQLHTVLFVLLVQSSYMPEYGLFFQILLAFIVSGALVAFWNHVAGAPYTIFKFYPESNGAGLNFYLRGWRLVGLDWHQLLIKQDLKTGKPLHPKDQFFINRPHVDLPTLDMHHWPWAVHETKQAVSETKAKKDAQREAKRLKKEEKKQRRSEKLAERANVAVQAVLEEEKESQAVVAAEDEPMPNLFEEE